MSTENNIPDIKELIADTIRPEIVGLRDWLDSKYMKLLQDMDDKWSDLINQLDNRLTAHINNTENPHSVRPRHLFTVSAAKPNNAQGVPGDMWVQYLSITVDDMP